METDSKVWVAEEAVVLRSSIKTVTCCWWLVGPAGKRVPGMQGVRLLGRSLPHMVAMVVARQATMVGRHRATAMPLEAEEHR